ncbi:MAG: serine/threonine-protein kinase [Nannocystaceae bacterium]
MSEAPATEASGAALREARPAKDLEGLRALAGLRARLFGRRSAPLVVGRYALRQRLGAGGLGVVYAAHDPQLDREVAIKLLRDPTGSGRVREQGRLLREARAMAQLSHPNVVEVFDVGTYEGLHGLDDAELPGAGVFIVMAKLEGQTLGDWLEAGPHPWAAVLARFEAAGRGLAAAHAAGVVHRDFKPANVFVESSGQVRVLDFGLARGHGPGSATAVDSLTSGLSSSSSASFEDGLRSITVAGAVMGTPAYMAPEQHEGSTADARSDQYSFCAALYHGLFGVRPFPGTELRELVTHKQRLALQAPTPSVPVPRWLRSMVRRGLSPEPTERWPSMEVLLQQLRRRPRRARRQWLAMGGGAVVLAAIGWMGAGDSPPSCADEPTGARAWTEPRREAVTSALARAHELPAQAPTAEPQVLAGLDAYATALERDERAACEAALVTPADPELERRRGCLRSAATHFETLVQTLAEADATVAQRAATAVTQLPPLERCGDAKRLRAEEGPAVPIADEPAAQALRAGLAEVSALLTAGTIDVALSRAHECVEQARTLGHPPLLAEAMWWQGHAQRNAGQLEPALPKLEQAAHLAAAHGHDKVAALAAVELTTALGALARYDEALEWARHAEAAALRFGRDRYPLARAYASRGTVLRLLGRNEESYQLYLDALRVQQLDDASSHELPTLLNNLGTAALGLGRNHEALEHYGNSHARLTVLLGPDHPQTAAARMNLGIVTAELGRYDQALQHYSAARAAFVERLGPRDQRVAYCDTNLGNLLLDQHRYVEARDHLAAARDLFSELLGPDHPNTATTRAGWGLAQLRLGEPALARPALEQALHDLQEAVGPEHPHVGVITGQVGQALLAQGDLPAARERLEAAVALLQRIEAEPGLVHEARFHLARAQWEAGEHAEAWSVAQQVQHWLREHDPATALDDVDTWLAAHPEPAPGP